MFINKYFENFLMVEFDRWVDATFGPYNGPYNQEYFERIDSEEAYICLTYLEVTALETSLTHREMEFLEAGRVFFKSLSLDRKMRLFEQMGGNNNLFAEGFRDSYIVMH